MIILNTKRERENMIKLPCEICNKLIENPRVNSVTCGNKNCLKAYQKAYNQRPERKAYQKAYNQRPEWKAYKKAYNQRPEQKAYKKAYQKAYNQKRKLEGKHVHK